jgi:hypothetical protein
MQRPGLRFSFHRRDCRRSTACAPEWQTVRHASDVVGDDKWSDRARTIATSLVIVWALTSVFQKEGKQIIDHLGNNAAHFDALVRGALRVQQELSNDLQVGPKRGEKTARPCAPRVSNIDRRAQVGQITAADRTTSSTTSKQRRTKNAQRHQMTTSYHGMKS